MPFSIPRSTKIITLVTAPFLFILIGVLCLSVNLLCVHFTVPSGRRGALFFLWTQMYTATHSSKRFKPLPATILL